MPSEKPHFGCPPPFKSKQGVCACKFPQSSVISPRFFLQFAPFSLFSGGNLARHPQVGFYEISGARCNKRFQKCDFVLLGVADCAKSAKFHFALKLSERIKNTVGTGEHSARECENFSMLNPVACLVPQQFAAIALQFSCRLPVFQPPPQSKSPAPPPCGQGLAVPLPRGRRQRRQRQRAAH